LAAAVGSCDSGRERREAEAFAERWRALYNSHDLAGFTALYAERGNCAVPGMVYFTRSRAEMRETLEKAWHKFPDMRIAENPRVVAGEEQIAILFDLVFTARRGPVRQTGATFLRVEDGLIAHQFLVMRR
jgi:hypothetical protein